ncbi:HAD family phosphatase [Jatrophihabitans sp.]|uniref:HAD family hydrolase n=1 Tax=Jatrophihabitans sp. TaxID=1932789 RepID=UPI0030C77671|nr:Phosphorylated carbohydrates phosphatase [Jatrophihabitans sp.]
MELAAVLIDMDGTLVDTEPYWMAAEFALVDEFGGSWSDEHAHALVGNALLTSAHYLREHGGVDLEPELIVERLLTSVVAAAREELPWRPGARELLASLRAADVPVALVTMSYDVLAQTMIDGLPAGTFDAVITGDQVVDGKPHPEAYLTAAARLGVDPTHCVAIEDSPTGLASAEAAGCVVVAVPHRVTVAPAPRRRFVDSLTALNAETLRNWMRQS